jgi:hypothetical protein
MKKNIITGAESENWPNVIGATINATPEQAQAAGWRDVPEQPPLEAGYTRVSSAFGEGDGVTGAWTVVDRLQQEIDAEQAAADLATNAPRYVLENQYIILCDALRQALGQTAIRAKLGFEELPPMMMMLKAGNKDAYESLRDALDMVNAALLRYDVRWWDNAVYHPQPELQAASLAILELAK